MSFYVLVLRRLPTVLAVVFVLNAYAFFASYGTYSFQSRPWDFRSDRPGDGPC